MPIGNRYLNGQPILPYANVKAYPGTDLFLDLQFVDHTNTPVVPTSISIEIDDITNSILMAGPTTLTSTGSSTAPFLYTAFASAMTLQVSGSALQMSYPYTGSQLCQFGMQFTAIDSVTGNSFTANGVVAIVELCALATVSGLAY